MQGFVVAAGPDAAPQRALVVVDLGHARLALAPISEDGWPLAAAQRFTCLPAALAALAADAAAAAAKLDSSQRLGARRTEKRKRTAPAAAPAEIAMCAEGNVRTALLESPTPGSLAGRPDGAADASSGCAAAAAGTGAASVAAALAAMRRGVALERQRGLDALKAAAEGDRCGWAAEWLAQGCLEV